jgi:hypothetical protein
MAKDKDWIDYAIIGSNAAQNVQLRDLQQKLGGMASLAAREQAVAAMEDERREIVFKANSNLAGMRALVAENRAGVLALVKQALADFEEYGISSACFRAYEDKERVGALIGGYVALADECAAVLSPAERTEAELVAKYRSEENDLKGLVELQEAKEALDSARAELDQAIREVRLWRKKHRLPTILVGVGAVIFLIGAVLLVAELVASAQPNYSASHTGRFLNTIIAGIVLIIWGAAADHNFPQQAAAASVKVKGLEDKLHLLESSLDVPTDCREQWGCKSTLELKQMQAERHALMAKVFKQDAKAAVR